MKPSTAIRAGPCARVGDPVDLVRGQGDGLLAQDVLAGLQPP